MTSELDAWALSGGSLENPAPALASSEIPDYPPCEDVRWREDGQRVRVIQPQAPRPWGWWRTAEVRALVEGSRRHGREWACGTDLRDIRGVQFRGHPAWLTGLVDGW